MSSQNDFPVAAASSSQSDLPVLATSSSQSGLQVAAASNAAQRHITPLSQKPLPSPPVARAGTTSPIRAGRSLLDASEKPLRRSPPGMPHRQEEWPTLSPHKSVTPKKYDPQETLLGSSFATSVKLGQVERFPISGAISHPKPESDGYAISRVASSESQIPSASLASGRPAAPVHLVPESSIAPINPVNANAADLRRSSIPVSYHSGSSTMSQRGTQQTKPIGADITHVKSSENARNECSILKNRTANHTSQKLVNLAVDIPHNGEVDGTSEGIKTVKPLSGLEAIEESPKPNFEVRRLSVASSEIGPTLKISKSAENVIMGTKSHDENHPGSTRRRNSRRLSVEKDFHQQDMLLLPGETSFQQQQLQNVNAMTDVSNKLVGPSSLGFSQKSSRVNRVDNDNNDEKIKTEDVSYSLSTNHLRQRPKMPALQKADIFSADDPFFDRPRNGRGNNCSSASAAQSSVPKDPKKGISVEDEHGVSPLLGRNVASSDNQAKGKTAQRGVTTQAQIHNDPGMSSSDTWNIETPREVPDPAGSKATIIRNDNATENFPTTPAPAFGLGIDNRHIFPPRSSSRTTPANYTDSAKASSISPSVIYEPQEAEFFNPQSGPGSFVGDTSAPPNLGNGESKRDSVARESNKSHGSSTQGVISNIRGFFHKRSSDSGSSTSAQPTNIDDLDVGVAGSGSPFPILTDIHPAHRPTIASANRSAPTEARTDVGEDIDTPGSPSVASPVPDEICATTAMAMQLLDSVRMEDNSPQKERRLELGTIMVEAITQARKAEKAMEEARHAARKAAVAHILCKKSVREIATCIEQWKEEMGSE